MYEQFKIHFKENFQIVEGEILLLAISGGVDSMVLFHLFSKLGLDFQVAHCNFGLRGDDSDHDASFVQDIADQYGVPLHSVRFDTEVYAKLHKCSIQVAARELRYNYFEELMLKKEMHYLATAHHADDNLETFFINLSRGTGLDGLCGIPEKSNAILRPLLPFSRLEIETFARHNNIKWREDRSNQDKKYLRNKIRHDLIPLLKELNPYFLDTFSTTLENLKGSRLIIDDTMTKLRSAILEEDDKEGLLLRFKISELAKISDNRTYLYQLFYPYGFHQYDDIKSLIEGQSGKQVLSSSHRLIKDREHLLLSSLSDLNKPNRLFHIDDKDDSYAIDKHFLEIASLKADKNKFNDVLDQRPNVAFFDKDALDFPLYVRKWEKGDYFYPFGMKGKKKLSKYFKDEKFSLLEKENIWLLCSGTQIIWLIGKRIDDRYKVSKHSKNILKASFKT